MDINNNIELLNKFFITMRFTSKQRLEVTKIAKVSKDFVELQENLNWDSKYKNIK